MRPAKTVQFKPLSRRKPPLPWEDTCMCSRREFVAMRENDDAKWRHEHPFVAGFIIAFVGSLIFFAIFYGVFSVFIGGQ